MRPLAEFEQYESGRHYRFLTRNNLNWCFYAKLLVCFYAIIYMTGLVIILWHAVYPVWKLQRPSRVTSPSFISGCLVGCWNGRQLGMAMPVAGENWWLKNVENEVMLPCLILFDSYKMISLLSPPLQAGLFFKLSCLSILGGEALSFSDCSFGSLPCPPLISSSFRLFPCGLVFA